jgi:methanesulfonate monooxygenase large subunit
MRIDHLIPVSPGCTLLESRGLGVKGDPSEVREMRIKHHNDIWGYSGSNLPEDVAATESQWAMMQTGAVRYSIIAREGPVYTDESLRFYYSEWSKRMGRAYWDPFNDGSTIELDASRS